MSDSRKVAACIAALTVAATLAACGDSDSETTDGTSESRSAQGGESTGDGDDRDDGEDQLRDLYADVLDRADEFEFQNEDFRTRSDFTGEYEYAVTDINADNRPELLLKAVAPEISVVRVFSSTEDIRLIEPGKLFGEGAASAGGERLGFYTAADHDGVLASDGRSGSGQLRTTEWALDGDEMQETGQTWEYRIDRVPGDLDSAQVVVPWTDINDRSALDDMSVAEDAADSPEPDHDGPNPDPPAGSSSGSASGDDGDSAASSGGSLPQSATASPGQIGGDCGTVDGVTVTAGDATSCGFAMNVAQEALHPGSWGPGVAPDPTVTAPWGSTTVTTSSPATGETYTLDCSSGTDPFGASCRGGNDASVRFHKQGYGGLMYLRDGR